MGEFEDKAQAIRDAKPAMDDAQKAEIYGLFKQGSLGDNTVDKPGLMSGFEARGKWDAWEAKKGMSQDDAKQAYVDLVNSILG
jgi:diazepam-binding inhibitor (GABA receptor modulating acyl-CoA-binding protein)